MYALWVHDGGEILAYQCAMRAYGANGGAKSLLQEDTARLVVCGCQYDRSTTGGTILDIARIATDAAGNARAVVDILARSAPRNVPRSPTPCWTAPTASRRARPRARQCGSWPPFWPEGSAASAPAPSVSVRLDGTTPRVEVTADAVGNRSNVTYTAE